ncbi:MAG: polysaccharide deacetylase family protein [Planctomycetes bacterium]|nr:polysaccharide deacetylase family protein [Planctomycetota bacterium]
MRKIEFSWPEGKRGALTTSWDDGTIHDRRLVEIHNKNGLKGTWNLNSGNLGQTGNSWHDRIQPEEVTTLYAGHEVAVHSVNHPWLQRQPDDVILAEILEDRRALEALVGYPVRGMALPFGSYDQRVLKILAAAGIVHCRPTTRTESFGLPADFMEWATTCHHKADLMDLWDKFINFRCSDGLFYVWGHSYEFANDNNWEHFEEFAKVAGAYDNCWMATNMEIYDYVTAYRSLQFSVDLGMVRNTSAVKVWLLVSGELKSVDSGAVAAL